MAGSLAVPIGSQRKCRRAVILALALAILLPCPVLRADVPPAGAFEYLRTQAVARLYLDNIPNIQSSWVTQGLKVGQLGLLFGANDMGSLMLEENVVSAAGTVHHLTLDQIKGAICELGYVPRQRNVFYEYLD